MKLLLCVLFVFSGSAWAVDDSNDISNFPDLLKIREGKNISASSEATAAALVALEGLVRLKQNNPKVAGVLLQQASNNFQHATLNQKITSLLPVTKVVSHANATSIVNKFAQAFNTSTTKTLISRAIQTQGRPYELADLANQQVTASQIRDAKKLATVNEGAISLAESESYEIFLESGFELRDNFESGSTPVQTAPETVAKPQEVIPPPPPAPIMGQVPPIPAAPADMPPPQAIK